MAWLIVAIICSLVVMIPYAIFPLVLRMLAQADQGALTNQSAHQPDVDIVFAAYNEEKVIGDKLISVMESGYPQEKINVWVGSDLSSDATDEIVRNLSLKYPQINLVRMEKRSGKSAIINHLMKLGKADYVIGTDANIFFEKDAISNMIAPMLNHDTVDLVGGHLIYRGLDQQKTAGSISDEEQVYIQWENRTKEIEGEIWGAAMGVEGGCYAIRRTAFREIPAGTLMEDFFLTLSTLQRGAKVVMAMNALCSEDVSQDPGMEFKRKVRISQGNWQNTLRFISLIWTKPFPVGILFLCHKLLRWMTPFFGLAILFSILMHSIQRPSWWPICFGVYAFTLLGLLAPKLGINNKYSNLLAHFLMMNIALLLGFFQFIKKPESGIWQPTTRNAS